jgi:TPR repeat protein
MKRLVPSLLLGALALALCGGCTSAINTPAATVRPEPIKVSEALGEGPGCAAPGDEAELLIVDLPASARGDIEVAMGEGLVAVKYDCNQLKILKSCQIEGSYAFKGTLLKEELLRFENGDEIRANLPLSGTGVAAKLEGELQRGATLDLATVMVGQQRAARFEVAQDELKGRCDGATHFAQSIYVGAFAMRRGERAKAAAAVEVFGSGASGSSASDSSFQQSDGDLGACRQTAPDAKAPAQGCGALLRLYLLPISPAGTAPTAAPEDKEVVRLPGCPEGMSRVAGKCTRAEGPACGEEAPLACQGPCEAGDGLACGVYGLALRYGEGVPKDREAAALALSRGCELGHGLSCTTLSRQYAEGKGVTADPARSAALAERGCALGDGDGCFLTGLAYMDGDGVAQDEARGFAAYEQGCAAGQPNACNNLGKAYSVGQGVASDVFYSFKLYVRACEGGSAQACYNVGVRYSKGKGTDEDPARSLQFYQRACGMGHGEGCYRVGKALGDPAWFERACELGFQEACGG